MSLLGTMVAIVRVNGEANVAHVFVSTSEGQIVAGVMCSYIHS